MTEKAKNLVDVALACQKFKIFLGVQIGNDLIDARPKSSAVSFEGDGGLLLADGAVSLTVTVDEELCRLCAQAKDVGNIGETDQVFLFDRGRLAQPGPKVREPLTTLIIKAKWILLDCSFYLYLDSLKFRSTKLYE